MKKILITLLLVSLYLTANSQIKISQLTEATSINTTDLFLLSKGDASRKLQYSTLKNIIFNPINYPLRVLYSGDSIRIGLSGDDAQLATSQNLFRFNKPIYYNASLLSTVAQLGDTSQVLRGLINNSFPYTKTLEKDSSLSWSYNTPSTYKQFYIDTLQTGFAISHSGLQTGLQSVIGLDGPINYLNLKTKASYFDIVHDSTGFKYENDPDTAQWDDGTNYFVTAPWVLDRIGSGATLTDGVFKASGSTFDYWPDSANTGAKGGFYKFDGTQWPTKEVNYALNGNFSARRFFISAQTNYTPFSISNTYAHSNPLLSLLNQGHNAQGISIQNYYDAFGVNKGIYVSNNSYAGLHVANNNIKTSSNYGVLIENNSGATGLYASGDSSGHLIQLSMSGTGDLINSTNFRVNKDGRIMMIAPNGASYSAVYLDAYNTFTGSSIYIGNGGQGSDGLSVHNAYNTVAGSSEKFGVHVVNNDYCGITAISDLNKRVDSYSIRATSYAASIPLYLESDSIGDVIKITNTGTGDIIDTNTSFDVTGDGAVYEKGTFGEIFKHPDSTAVPQSIPTGSTYTKILGFTDDGDFSNITPNADADKITITKTGKYKINLSLSYASGTANVKWTAAVFVGGTRHIGIGSTGKALTAGDVRSTSLTGIINVTSVPTDIDYRVLHDNGGSVDLTFEFLNLTVDYLGLSLHYLRIKNLLTFRTIS